MAKSVPSTTNSGARRKPPQSQILDELTQQKVCAVLALGCSRKTAADYLGCSPELIRSTARRRKEFAVQATKSEAICEISALTQLSKALKDERNWRAVIWLLERRFPDRYGLRAPRSASPRQVIEVMNQLIDVVAGEVHDAEDQRRVVARLQSLVQRLGVFDDAGETP